MHTHDGSHIDAYDSYDNTIIEIKWAYIPTKKYCNTTIRMQIWYVTIVAIKYHCSN